MMNLMKYLLVTPLLLNYCLISDAKRFNIYRSNDNVMSLCDDPVIYTADRLLNDTVRLYRGDHYWELKGLPGTKRHLDGPHKLWYPGFKTVQPNTKLVTFLTGNRKGNLIRFEGQRWYAWRPDGTQRHGDTGITTSMFPSGGFTAVFHNGDTNKPLYIGFETKNVYYYSNVEDIYSTGIRVDGNVDGYVGGQYGENFPPDITAAFSYKPTKPGDGYLVYLFKADKYCFLAVRPTTASVPVFNSCADKWRLNTELFGCDSSKNQSTDNQVPEGDVNITVSTDKPITTTGSFGIAARLSITNLIVSFIIKHISSYLEV